MVIFFKSKKNKERTKEDFSLAQTLKMFAILYII